MFKDKTSSSPSSLFDFHCLYKPLSYDVTNIITFYNYNSPPSGHEKT